MTCKDPKAAAPQMLVSAQTLNKIKKNDSNLALNAPAAAQSVSVASYETKIYFKKRVFKNIQDIPVDPVEFNLTYAQASMDVIHDMYPLTEKIALQLGGLKAQVDWGNFDPTQPTRFTNLAAYLPMSLLPRLPPEQWVKGVAEHQAKIYGKNGIQSRILYMEILKQFKFYGSTLYPAKFKGFWQYPENIVLAVSCSGVSILLKNKTIVETFTYDQIKYWDLEPDTITLHIIKGATATYTSAVAKENQANRAIANTDRTDIYKFEARFAEEMSALMKEYCPRPNLDVKTDRDLYAADNELAYLQKDLEKTRLNLIKRKLLYCPISAEDNDGKMTLDELMRLGKQSKDPRRPLMQENVEIVKGKFDWKPDFKQEPCIQLNIFGDDNILLDEFESLHVSLLTAGAVIPPADQSTNPLNPKVFTSIAQSYCVKCQKWPKLLDELYMQLIKMTNEFPGPNAPPVLLYWKYLLVLCGFQKPNIPEVLDYLKAHLKKSSVTDIKTPQDKLRKEEMKHAKACFRTLQKTIVTDIRKFPPSSEEISSVTRLNPIYYRFYTADGQFRAVAFDPWSNVQDVIIFLKDKMKLEGTSGLSLYEYLNGEEKRLKPRQKMADILYQLEEAVVSGRVRDHRFVLKKRLFLRPLIPSGNEIEEEFLLIQAIQEIRKGKFPLTHTDCLYFAALRTQIEYGDVAPNKPIE